MHTRSLYLVFSELFRTYAREKSAGFQQASNRCLGTDLDCSYPTFDPILRLVKVLLTGVTDLPPLVAFTAFVRSR